MDDNSEKIALRIYLDHLMEHGVDFEHFSEGEPLTCFEN
jgi:hypothetical protein